MPHSSGHRLSGAVSWIKSPGLPTANPADSSSGHRQCRIIRTHSRTLLPFQKLWIAVALLIGLARRSAYLAAVIFSLLIWAIPEGFGGPYGSDATDIGIGIIYAIAFFALYGMERLAIPPVRSIDNYLNK